MSYGINGFDAYFNEDNLKQYARQIISVRLTGILRMRSDRRKRLPRAGRAD